MSRIEAQLNEAVEIVRNCIGDLVPEIGIILGSGLNALAEKIEEAQLLALVDLPGFPAQTAIGHSGQLLLGKLHNIPVAVLQGRYHYYESGDLELVARPVRLLKRLGCAGLFATNAAGCLQRHWTTPSLMLIADHINMIGGNPLIGRNLESFGPRFPDMTNAYDVDLRKVLSLAGGSVGLHLHEGVYLATTGPSFETPAEIRAMSMLGADAVGMSTVPEVICARHCGMRVAAVSALTNLAAGYSERALSAQEVLDAGEHLQQDLYALLEAGLPEISRVLRGEASERTSGRFRREN